MYNYMEYLSMQYNYALKITFEKKMPKDYNHLPYYINSWPNALGAANSSTFFSFVVVFISSPVPLEKEPRIKDL